MWPQLQTALSVIVQSLLATRQVFTGLESAQLALGSGIWTIGNGRLSRNARTPTAIESSPTTDASTLTMSHPYTATARQIYPTPDDSISTKDPTP
jgi:hypothetical protein